MWPGEQQPGGQQNPQGPYPQDPNQQPPYQAPSPYPTPSPYQNPSPYQAPGYGYPQQAPQQPQYQQPAPPPQWGPPTVPGGPGPGGPPPGNRRNTTVIVSIVAAVAVIAAVVIGGVYLSKDDKGGDVADPSKSPTVAQSATPTPAPTASNSTAADGGTGDDSRGDPSAVEIKPVVPGWQVVRRTERNVAFDVPANWTLASEGTLIGFEDKGKPAVTMGAPAFYKENWCGTSDRAAVGTKGANGAKSVQEAAEVQAESWAYWGYQEDGKVTVAKTAAKPFSNTHGITGYSSSATAKNVPKKDKCSSDGVVFTVAWVDSTKALTVWVLYADRGAGVTDGVPDATITTIMGSIRELKKK